MGTFCRLCVGGTQENDIKLFDEKTGEPHLVAEKLRQFVDLPPDPLDSLPRTVCRSCVVNLDFCIQFVDRCRRVVGMLQSGTRDLDFIQNDLQFHYPYLYPGNQQATSSSSNQEANNCQTVPFTQGAFFGPTSNISHGGQGHEQSQQQQAQTQTRTRPFARKSVAPQPVPESREVGGDGKSKIAMYRHSLEADNMVVEVEPQDVYVSKGKTSGGGKPSHQHKVRKILPKTNSESNFIRKIPNKVTPTGPAVRVSMEDPVGGAGGKREDQFILPVKVNTMCRICRVVFSAANVQDIQQHVCSPKDKKVNCAIEGCGRKFFTKTSLNYHMIHYHKETSSKASESGDKTKSAIEIKDNNKPKKMFVCVHPNCDKSYSAKHYLVEHERTHSGEKPFHCSNCKRSFYRILDLKKHKLLKVCQ